MLVGVPREIKPNEHRVAMVPAGVDALRRAGHEVLISPDAGIGSGITDQEYKDAGAKIAADNAEVFSRAQMIVKVKEPIKEEYNQVRRDQIVFTYFHFAASRELTDAMVKSGAICVAYETIEDDQRRLPLLTPMSEVAGRMSIQEGAK